MNVFPVHRSEPQLVIGVQYYRGGALVEYNEPCRQSGPTRNQDPVPPGSTWIASCFRTFSIIPLSEPWLLNRDFEALIPRLDWVLKRFLIERSLETSTDLENDPAALKHLDLVYSSLDRKEGLYWALEQEGAVDQLISTQEIENRICRPPEDTRLDAGDADADSRTGRRRDCGLGSDSGAFPSSALGD